MKAIGSNLIFEYLEIKKTFGGIELINPVDADNQTITVRVVSVGSGVNSVKCGDLVLIPKLMKTPIDVDKGLYSTLESQVLAILE